MVAMKIVNKSVISNRENYLRLLGRLHDMYLEYGEDNIIKVKWCFRKVESQLKLQQGYEWFESIDRYYLAFELAAGGDMFDRISVGTGTPKPGLTRLMGPLEPWPLSRVTSERSAEADTGGTKLRAKLWNHPPRHKGTSKFRLTCSV